MLSDAEILAAFVGAFDKPIYMDHIPSPDERLLIRLKAVLAAAKKAEGKEATDA